MMQPGIALKPQLHKNPSQQKLRKHSSKRTQSIQLSSKKSLITNHPAPTPTHSHRHTHSHTNSTHKAKSIANTAAHTSRPSSNDKMFLDKCYEHVYIQNLTLSQMLAKKKSQYNRLLLECERMAVLNDPNSFKNIKRCNSPYILTPVQQNINSKPHKNQNQTPDNKKALKSSLSSIQSVGDSSLITQRFIPYDSQNRNISQIAVNSANSGQSSSRNKNSSQKQKPVSKQHSQQEQKQQRVKFSRNMQRKKSIQFLLQLKGQLEGLNANVQRIKGHSFKISG